MKNFNFEISDETMNDTNNLIVQDTVQEWEWIETYELEEKEINELKEIEQNLHFHEEKSKKHMLKYAQAIYDANKLFSNNGNGNFRKWLENNHISHSTAHTLIKRLEVYNRVKELNPDKAEVIMDLPQRELRGLETMDIEEVQEIIESENPKALLKEKNKEIKEVNDEIVYHDRQSLEELEKKKESIMKKIQKLQEMYAILVENKDIKDYFDLEVKFNVMIADINKIIAESMSDIFKH